MLYRLTREPLLRDLLRYVIQDEVLKITSEHTQQADTTVHVYDVADLAVFRPDRGLWIVRGIGRLYFGGSGDLPARRGQGEALGLQGL
mgnify:CR=1 FL=1